MNIAYSLRCDELSDKSYFKKAFQSIEIKTEVTDTVLAKTENEIIQTFIETWYEVFAYNTCCLYEMAEDDEDPYVQVLANILLTHKNFIDQHGELLLVLPVSRHGSVVFVFQR